MVHCTSIIIALITIDYWHDFVMTTVGLTKPRSDDKSDPDGKSTAAVNRRQIDQITL